MPTTKKRTPLLKANPKNTKKTTETRIKEYLIGHGFGDAQVVTKWDLGCDTFDSKTLETVIIAGNKTNNIQFTIDTTQYCCGLREIGNILADTSIISLPDDLYLDIITKMLRDIVNQHNNGSQRKALCFTVPIDEEIYDTFVEAAKKVGFEEKGEWINSNSGNRLKHFMNI